MNSLVLFVGIVTKEMYIDILRLLREAVTKKGHEKWRTSIWFLLHDNAPAHWSDLVKDFLAKNNLTTPEIPQYSRDLESAGFYLFLSTEISINP